MAEKIEVEVELSPEGEVTLKVKGVQGKSCADLSALFEEGLGEVRERKKTADYFRAEARPAQRNVPRDAEPS